MYPGMLTITEDDEYRYDVELGEKPIRFIEKYCVHAKGSLMNKPMILEPIQKYILSSIYGWVSKETGLRRFNHIWWESAIGSGKSPLIACATTYELVAGGEPGAECYSIANDLTTARVIFDTARFIIDRSDELRDRLEVLHSEIRYAESNGLWRVISGTGKRAGTAAQVVTADEIHQCPAKFREVYDGLRARMGKRRQPILWCATNAGESRQSLCWELHEEAVAVLEGKSANKQLFPIIWAAPPDAPMNIEAWKAANPLLGVTIPEEKVAKEWELAKGVPALEASFRRLYAGEWVRGSRTWIDLNIYDGCVGSFTTEEVAKHDLYIGIDGADSDDLFSVTHVYAGEKFYVDAKFWLPRSTAEHYDKKAGTSYAKWEPNYITLADAPTLSEQYKRKTIAASIIELHKVHPIKAVCYDRARVDSVIDEIEKAGIICLPIAQGYTVSPGCRELDGRLKEKSIRIVESPIARMCAENVTVKVDERANFWPIKVNAGGSYAGTRSQKIDFIQALVTALTEARKHNYGKKSVAQAWLV